MESIAKVRRLYHVQGKGFKTIARELRISKNTVKRIIRQDIKIPCYQRSEWARPVLGHYIERLHERLLQDVQEPKRRRRTIKKLYDELHAEGYKGSYDAVNACVLEWRKQNNQRTSQAFVPLEFEAGEAFQFDWSEEEIELAGVLTRLKVAHIRLCYSRYFLMVAYPNEQLEMVLDAHNQAFKFFGGSCCKGIYDNMKTAVKAILGGKEREFNQRFLQMCSHYLFEPIACNPASGWEKGQVENQVGVGRNNFFTPLVKVETLEELNTQLEAFCISWAKVTSHPEWKTRTVLDVYQEERSSLIPYWDSFESYKIVHEVVSPCSLITYDTNSYSVDVHYVGLPVDILVYAKEIKVQYKGRTITEHKRCFERYQRVYDPWHYVPLLERKPGALRNGAPFKRLKLPSAMEQVRKHLSHYSDGDHRFIRILLKVSSYGLEKVNNACAMVLSQGGCNDTVVMQHLTFPSAEPQEEERKLQLSSPPTEDCQSYNLVYLSKETLLREAAYVL